ncbi:APC family permease [Candidatus Uhrbacteria bacterium]|nr:APC family permease [Candidatus Uhrbacteria bacterium]
MPSVVKRLLVGRPLKTIQTSDERLTKRAALAIFSSDALSSTAYATEEILLVLVLAGSAGMSLALPVAAAIAVLLGIIVTSYGQTIRAYPSGGGAYIVAKENLGHGWGLIAGASLLIDYILTAAVSVSAGVAAITSAFPNLYPERVLLGVLVLAVITIGNLRGLRESGRLFTVPAYLFVGSAGLMILAGVWKLASGAPFAQAPASGSEAITWLLVLHAFASGCAALTGIEAISNGVQAFQKPEAKNARTTLFVMGGILAVLFLGITFLARMMGIVPVEGETVVSQIARRLFDHGFLYYLVQCSTALILLMAANTSFAGFPRLASILARDKYLPIQLVNMGDRLVFSNGIMLLALFSALLIAGFGGDTHRLIPLYAIGVFTGFALSQFGLVKKWISEKDAGWRGYATLNLAGGLVTTVVLVILTAAKFWHGAWAILVVVPILVAAMLGIRRHYTHLRTALTLGQVIEAPIPNEHYVIMFIGDIHKGTVAAARYAKTLKPTMIKALHISLDERDSAEIREKWDRWGMDIPLIITPSPYRQVVDILLHYVREIEHQHPQAAITVILPEFVCPHWWQLLLHNHIASRIKNALLHERVAVVSVPIQLQ